VSAGNVTVQLLARSGGGGGGIALSHGDCEGSFFSPSYMPLPAALGSTSESATPLPSWYPPWGQSIALSRVQLSKTGPTRNTYAGWGRAILTPLS
jgi:hypothetical protein